jgi:ABC-type transporter Mla MlaB component
MSGVPQVLGLPPTLVIHDVRAFADEVRAAFANGGVRIDTVQLEQVDTAGLQLLLAARRAAAQHGLTFEWINASAYLSARARAAGLNAALGLPEFPS